MNRIAVSIVAGLLAATLGWAQDVAKGRNCGSCGNENYGTSIEWEGSPAEAAKKAKEQEKLVFVLHVSGYFEDPKFT